MLVFIDESGCPGFKFARGSDPVFALGMVVFDSGTEAAQTEAAVRNLRRTIPHAGEFKFSKTSADVRDQFFRGVAASPFRVYTVVVRKDRVYSSHLRTNQDAFYSYFLKLLLGAGAGIADARIRLDGSGGRDFQRALKTYLRKQLGTGIADFRMVDSERDQLAQLADMCVGAIARSYRDNRPDPSRWRNQLRPRIADVWDFR
jgi:hypothetical protein